MRSDFVLQTPSAVCGAVKVGSGGGVYCGWGWADVVVQVEELLGRRSSGRSSELVEIIGSGEDDAASGAFCSAGSASGVFSSVLASIVGIR